ncbi:MAG TPA: NUDIX domain-containing protein [Aggregatilineales bacterium]|nr:NUDIX domain-containing protein [Aggregatilineales bacterium]
MGASEQGSSQVKGRWLVVPRTLCFILNGEDVLLMKRSPHKRIFPNRYNGVGGHVERDEDMLRSARREIREETGLEVRDLRLRAVYNVDAGDEMGIGVFVFTAISDQRTTIESDEGTLHWIPRDEILNYDLVEDIPLILPRILAMGPHDPPLFVHLSYDASDQIQLRFAGE